MFHAQKNTSNGDLFSTKEVDKYFLSKSAIAAGFYGASHGTFWPHIFLHEMYFAIAANWQQILSVQPN